MGYTHYWEVKDQAVWAQIWPRLISDANQVIGHANVELRQDEYHRDHATIEEGIKLNGTCDHEPFVLLPAGPGSMGFAFCKTARKPYDLVVATVLMRAKMLAGNGFRVNSDGEFDSDLDTWVAAKKLYMQLWPSEQVPTEDIFGDA
ncbi:Uncharacterized protein BP5553_08650 [Venustampulla echinocandica]|uniref:Uncharacterized protein n=1 Tax=Venustampulla echinocandica TaxID=2656787 RepID=A0A370TEV6_9HELO|nr:Uncharacterized protein BP5553_08650 [Venustampulla echinocandica]RDL33211.1 Uncharacterized protein BP5553_08650 [Venustampulla echinocandica]